jgi:hypothetical protein
MALIPKEIRAHYLQAGSRSGCQTTGVSLSD